MPGGFYNSGALGVEGAAGAAGSGGNYVLSLGNGNASLVLQGVTSYTDTTNHPSATETAVGMFVAAPSTLTSLVIDVVANDLTGSTVFTVMKNGVATTMTLSVPATTTGTFSDSAHTISVTTADRLTIRANATASGGGTELDFVFSLGGKGGSGDVAGPTSATDLALAIFNGTTGKIIKNSVITLDTDGNFFASDGVTGSSVGLLAGNGSGLGGGGDVNLTGGTTSGTGGGGSVGLTAGDAGVGGGNNGGVITLVPGKKDGAGANGYVRIVDPATGFDANISTAGITLDRTYTLPDHTGTVLVSGTSLLTTASDVAITDATKGFILKDTQGTPHYWRITVNNSGTLVITDIGTSP